MDSRWALALPRRVSAAGVLASIVYLAAALVAAGVGGARWLDVHIRLALYGGLLLFPHSVAVAYVASAARGPLARWAAGLALASTPLLAVPGLATGGGFYARTADAVVAVVFGAAAMASWVVSGARRGSASLSLKLFSLTYASAAGVAAYTAVAGPYPRFSILEPALAYTLAYPVSLIYSVTVHALPSTFKDEPADKVAWLLPLLDAAAAALVLGGRLEAGLAAGLAGMALYIPAARLYKLKAYASFLRGKKPSPAVRGMAYFLWGHWAVLGVIAVTAIYSASFVLDVPACSLLCIIHSLALGFASVHVAIHAPMMLPVILGLRHRRRYTPLPYLLLVASLLAWPYEPNIALILYAAGMAGSALVAWP